MHKATTTYLKNILFLLVLLSPSSILSQIEASSLEEADRFCCYEWLPEFRDSIFIEVDEQKVNQRRPYCVLTKLGQKNYGLHCWTGEMALETPTEWRNKLKLKFRNNSVQIKFGKEKYKYQVYGTSKGKYLLLKVKDNSK